MSSKQTDSRKGKVEIPSDFTLTSEFVKARETDSASDDVEAESQKAVEREVAGNSIATDETIQPNETKDSLQTQATEAEQPSIPTVAPKRSTTKQRKESFEEYRQTFLTVPKLEDRKPVFISCEVRDRIDEIVHRLGGRGRSVSGFIENLARHHLEIYQEDVEQWKKL